MNLESAKMRLTNKLFFWSLIQRGFFYTVKKTAASSLIIVVDVFDVCRILQNFCDFAARFFDSVLKALKKGEYPETQGWWKLKSLDLLAKRR